MPRIFDNMVLRTARKGAYAGRTFYGCSNYPRCHGIVNLVERRQ
jgi:ssDNA-binding Zn-finger/Zn-ribbon topoisomerase 1